MGQRLRRPHGAELRRLITTSYSVETVIEMHRADAFAFDVRAYPAITVIRRDPQGAAVVARASTGIEAAGSAPIRHVLANARYCTESSLPLPGLQAARVESWFSGADPWPCYSPERLALIKRLEAEFYPLESVGTGTKVGIGVATGADEIFVTIDPDVAEASRLLPLAMAYDTRDGTSAGQATTRSTPGMIAAWSTSRRTHGCRTTWPPTKTASALAMLASAIPADLPTVSGRRA